MKKITPPQESISVLDIVFYREDLEEIIHSLQAKEMVVTISDSGFEYETIDELIKQRGTRPREIKISGELKDRHNFGHITVSFSPGRVYVGFWGSGTPRELWYELFDFVNKRRSWGKRIFKPFFWGLVALIAFAIEIPGFFMGQFPKVTSLWAHLGLSLVIAIFPLSFAYSRAVPTVSLTRRNEGGFWKRNREALVLLAIGSVFGGIVTYIVTILTK